MARRIRVHERRMIATLTSMAWRLRSTPESIATPWSVKTRGAHRRPPRAFEITDCDLKRASSRTEHGVGLAMDDPALAEWSRLLTNWLRVRAVIR